MSKYITKRYDQLTNRTANQKFYKYLHDIIIIPLLITVLYRLLHFYTK